MHRRAGSLTCGRRELRETTSHRNGGGACWRPSDIFNLPLFCELRIWSQSHCKPNPPNTFHILVEFVTGVLADNPYRLSKSLTSELLGLRTARRGDYRVLFTLDVEEHILYAHRIEHRSDVYKPR